MVVMRKKTRNKDKTAVLFDIYTHAHQSYVHNDEDEDDRDQSIQEEKRRSVNQSFIVNFASRVRV